ncbi:AhpC/TSA family protein [Parabacteroides sp. OttesenSCG-928-G21]|nr:AhpC/TSA family protein [Parabacteroides sp. OttesenSCG-928-G21]
MKNRYFLISFLLLLSFFGFADNFIYHISGRIDNKYEGKAIEMRILVEDSITVFNTGRIVNGEFHFFGDEYIDKMATIVFEDEGEEYVCDVILEKGNIMVFLDSISFVAGTPLNDLHQNYKNYSRIIDGIITKEYKENVENKADPSTSKFDSLMIKRANFKREFQVKNISNIVGKTLFIKEVGQFWDPLFFEVYENLPQDVKEHPKVLSYASARKEIDESQERSAKLLNTKVRDITLLTIENRPSNLSEYIGHSKYLYIDFWASWCGPCLSEFPKLRSILDEYKYKGLNMLFVSIDENFDLWYNAAKKHLLGYDHLLDNTGGKMTAEVFSFSIIPHGVLLDENGTIIATDLWGDSLKKKLNELYQD